MLRATDADRRDPVLTEILATKMPVAVMTSRLLTPTTMTLAAFHEEAQRVESLKHRAVDELRVRYAAEAKRSKT